MSWADEAMRPRSLAEHLTWLKAWGHPMAETVKWVENLRDRNDVMTFAALISHGDDQHRDWLQEAAEAFVAGQPLPPPRSREDQPDALPLPVRPRSFLGTARAVIQRWA